MKSHPILTAFLMALTAALWVYASLPQVRAQIDEKFPALKRSWKEEPSPEEKEAPAPFSDPGTFTPVPKDGQETPEGESTSLSEENIEFPPLSPIEPTEPPFPAVGEDPTSADPTTQSLESPQQQFEPESLLRQVRKQLVSYRSVEADIVQRQVIGSRQLKTSGHYVQGTNLRIRLELEIQTGQSQATLLEVCDGQVLWTRQEIGEKLQLTRRDVRQILSAAAESPNREHGLFHAELGLGGLPALLASLENAFVFDPPETEQIQGHRLLVLRGTWTEAALKRWHGGEIKPGKRLPDYLPDEVRLYIDEKTLFPRRIQYLKLSGENSEPVTISTLDFVQVVINPELDDHLFEFLPPDGVIPTDVTRKYIEKVAGREKN